MSLWRGLSKSNEFLLVKRASLWRTTRYILPTTSHAPATRTSRSPLALKRFIHSDSSSTKQLVTFTSAFLVSLQRRDRPGIRQSYRDLARLLHENDHLRAASDNSSVLTEDQVRDAIGAIVASSDPEDFETAWTIVSDMPVLFGIPSHLGIHEYVVTTLLDSGRARIALEWLSTMAHSSDVVSPSNELWLKFVGRIKSPPLILQTIQLIRKSQQLSTGSDSIPRELASAALLPLFEKRPTLEHLSRILDELKSDLLLRNEAEILQLKQNYAGRRGSSSHIALLHEHYMHLRLQRCNEELAEASIRDGRRAVISLFKSLSVNGFEAQPSTLDAALAGSASVDDLYELEREMNVRATSSTWSLLVRNALIEGMVTQAQVIYSAAHVVGMHLDSRTTGDLICAISRDSNLLQLPDDQNIDNALCLYDDYARSNPEQGLEATVLITLLRVLLTSPNKTKYLPVAINIIEDMPKLKVQVDSSTLCAIIVMLLRLSTTFDRAFALYQFTKNQWPELSLGGTDYMAILRAYCRAPCAETSPLKPDQYLAIIKDMRRSGHSVTEEVYFLALSQLSAVRGAEQRYDAASVTRRIHTFLMVEPSFTPSTALWNQLMDTYFILDCSADAYRIWDRLMLSGHYDNTSLQIVFENCKATGNLSLMKDIYSRVNHSGFRLEFRNWNNWLVCLCSADLLDEAVRVLCLEMGRFPPDDSPDVQSARIVLDCANRNNQHEKTTSTIEQHLPRLWEILPETLKIRH